MKASTSPRRRGDLPHTHIHTLHTLPFWRQQGTVVGPECTALRQARLQRLRSWRARLTRVASIVCPPRLAGISARRSLLRPLFWLFPLVLGGKALLLVLPPSWIVAPHLDRMPLSKRGFMFCFPPDGPPILAVHHPRVAALASWALHSLLLITFEPIDTESR